MKGACSPSCIVARFEQASFRRNDEAKRLKKQNYPSCSTAPPSSRHEHAEISRAPLSSRQEHAALKDCNRAHLHLSVSQKRKTTILTQRGEHVINPKKQKTKSKQTMETRRARIREAQMNPRIRKILACSFPWKTTCLAKEVGHASTSYDLN